MQPFNSPYEARQSLLKLIFDQAAIDGVEFSDLERRVLSSTEEDESVTEEEWDSLYELIDEDSLWDRVALLLKHAQKRIKEEEGGASLREFKECMRVMPRDSSYLGGILELCGFAKSTIGIDWKSVAAFSVLGSVFFVFVLVYLIAQINSDWIATHVPFIREVAAFLELHSRWIWNPYGSFQRFAGWAIILVLAAYAARTWPKIVSDYLRRSR